MGSKNNKKIYKKNTNNINNINININNKYVQVVIHAQGSGTNSDRADVHSVAWLEAVCAEMHGDVFGVAWAPITCTFGLFW